MGLGPRPELADVARLAGRVLSRAVATARGQDAPVQRALAAHLGPRAAGWPVVTASWPACDQVNVQAGLDAWLAGPGLRHELLGLTGVRHGQTDLADLTAADPPRSPAGVPGIGSVTTAARPEHRHFRLPDLIIAATAEEHGATVLHFDADYDRIAEVTGQPVEWIAARGSL